VKRLAGFALLAAVLALPPAGGASTRSVRHALEAARAPVAQLARAGVANSARVRFYRYQQRIGGIPVLGGDTVVTDAPGTSGDLLVDHSRQGLARPGVARVAKAAAIRAAVARVGVRRYRAGPKAELAILPTVSRGRLVWRVLLPTAAPLGSFEVLVDARTSAIVRVRDLLRRATGQAAIFDPNPVETNGSILGLADANDADSPLLTSLRKPVTLERLNAGNCLDGQWVKAVLPGGPVCLAGRNFGAITRSNDQFEALMAYFHIDRTQAYVESLGFTNVGNRQLLVTADANIGDPGDGSDDNSFYDPDTGQISLGPGGVDDGEDADVIVHEYGHALQDSQVRGFGGPGQAGAMGEGFGDYLAADISATYTPNALWDPCFAEWDAVGACLRRVDTNQTVAQLTQSPCGAEIHCLGEVWSSALWAIRGALGGPAADKLIIQSHFSLTRQATFDEGSRALLAADTSLYGGANQSLLRSVLSTRGLLDLVHADDAPGGATPLTVPAQFSGELDASTDTHDVYALDLTGGHGLTVRMSGAGDFDLRLYPPGTTNVLATTALAGSTTPGTSNESLSYLPTASGTYYLDVAAVGGAGSYTLQTLGDADGDGAVDGSDNCPSVANGDQRDTDGDHIGDACDKFPRDAANDADHDGIGANADNCPKIANAKQRDWDRDGRGDACDRSSRIRIGSVSVRGHRVTLLASVRPITVDGADWNVFVQRSRGCARCRFAHAARQQGKRKLTSGRIRFTFVLARPGRYRVYATLTDPRYTRAKSGFTTIRVG
jgi:hypothetical protein